MFLTILLHLRIQDTKIHIPYLEIICIYVCRIKESAELCIQFCILTVSRRFCTIRLLMARKRVSAFCTLLIRVVRVQVTALCERAVNTLHACGLMRVPAKFGLAGRTRVDNLYKPGGRGVKTQPQWFESTYQSPAVLVIALEVMLGFADKDMLCHQQPFLLYNPAHD